MAEMTFRERAGLLLAGLEEGREVRAYLKRFSQPARGCFAVVKVGGAVVEQDLNPLADALSLLQFLGLPPVVVLGSGPQLDHDLAEAGFAAERRDGLRVTPTAAMPLVARAAGLIVLRLCAAMRERGASPLAVPAGIINVRSVDEGRLGAVGDVEGVDHRTLSQVLETGAVPILGCVHTDHGGRLLNVNADGVARSIAEALTPQKIVFVTGTGGVLDGSGTIIDSINLATDGEALFSSAWLDGGMRHKLGEIADLLSKLPLTSSVSVTSAAGLVRELFTHSGSGTLIRRGERISRVETVDRDALSCLIEGGFGKRLKPDFWDGLQLRYALVSERGRAAALVTTLEGVDLLDKFAVAGEARGEGLAKTLWRHLEEHSSELVWRSRRANPFNAFYAEQADGSMRRGPWTVFWRGRALEERMPRLADILAGRPGDFEGEA